LKKYLGLILAGATLVLALACKKEATGPSETADPTVSNATGTMSTTDTSATGPAPTASDTATGTAPTNTTGTTATTTT
jgi:hypothetical protein